jgi:hypothetical protein
MERRIGARLAIELGGHQGVGTRGEGDKHNQTGKACGVLHGFSRTFCG